MPKTNPPEKRNNYGTYGVFVLLLTAGYHHYFADRVEQNENAKISKAVIKKIQTVLKNKTNPVEQKVKTPALEQNIEISSLKPEAEIDFVNDNDRENCWDYIRRNLGHGDSEIQKFSESLESKLLRTYSSWYIGARNNLTQKEKIYTTGSMFAKALFNLDLVGNKSSSDSPTAFKEGVKMLEQLHSEEPKNSAFIVYLAIAYDKLGKQQEVAKLLSRLDKTEYYYSYRGSAIRDVYENATNIGELMMTVTYHYDVVYPNFRDLENFAKKYDISKVGFQIMEKNLPENKYYNPFDWDYSEHDAGYAILGDRRPELVKKYKTTLEYDKDIFSKQPFNFRQMNRALAKDCEVKTIDNQFKLVRNFLSKHPKRVKWNPIRQPAEIKN